MCNQRLLKDEAKAVIDKAAEAKESEIDQTPNATNEEEVAAKAKVDEAVTAAKNAIDQTTNNVSGRSKEWSRINQSKCNQQLLKRSSKSRNRQRCTS